MLNSNKVMVALSGGVDSSVCVRLLQEQGLEVHAVVMRMSDLHGETVEAAHAVANTLGVPLTELDLRQEFEHEIIAYFVREYANGRTPNPCIVCNPTIKFRHLLAEANRQNCRWIATGHYARVERTADGEATLLRGRSVARDQSYMLYRLGQDVLTRLLLPIGEREKPEVRQIAADIALPSADKPDSQENCFIAGTDYTAFLSERLGHMPEGDFIAPDGSVCGRHRGLYRYTVGQRKGLGIALGRPVFVRRLEPATNRVYLADAGGDVVTEAMVSDLTAISGHPFSEAFSADVKIRSAAVPTPAKVEPLDGGRARVVFVSPQRAVAPGQSIVFYEKDCDRVLGGGFIE